MSTTSQKSILASGMKILFVYKGRYQIRDTTTIEYFSSIAKEYGYRTDLVYDQDTFGVTDNVFSAPFLNKMFSKDQVVIDSIIKKDPQIVVFLDGFTRGPWNRDISKAIKAINKDIICVGLFYWDSNSLYDGYDYVLIGEPEPSFKKFLDDKIFDSDKGVFEIKELVDLDTLPFPDKTLFAPFIRFKDSYLVYASKGCPYHCTFCEETVYKNKLGEHAFFRTMSPERSIAELMLAKENYHIKEVIFKDSVFTWNKDWLRAYLKEYREKIDLPYKCFAKVDNFDEEIAKLLKESKCYCVEFGVQTFNKSLKRGILKRMETTETLLKAFMICDKYKLRYDVDHIFGFPGETAKDHIESAKVYSQLKYMNRIKCHNLVWYRESEIFVYAPDEKKKDNNYLTDFHSSISGEKDMIETNKCFQKYYKILPLIPQNINNSILNGQWIKFRYIPNFVIVFLMILIALKNGDKRFGVYLMYYPRKIRQSLFQTTVRNKTKGT